MYDINILIIITCGLITLLGAYGMKELGNKKFRECYFIFIGGFFWTGIWIYRLLEGL